MHCTQLTCFRDNCYDDFYSPPAFRSRISEVARQTICELGTLFLWTAVACAFTAPLGQLYLVTTALSTLYTNMGYRIILFALKNMHTSQHSLLFQVISWLPATRFALFDAITRDTLTHELGHASLFKLLYKGTTQIALTPPSGGYTSWQSTGPSSLGHFLGPKMSFGLFAGGGPAFSFIVSLCLIAVAHFQQRAKPELARYCNAMAITSIVSHTQYALSAYTAPSPGHDFVALALIGVPPLCAAINLIALPIIFKCALDYFSPNPSSPPEEARYFTPIGPLM